MQYAYRSSGKNENISVLTSSPYAKCGSATTKRSNGTNPIAMTLAFMGSNPSQAPITNTAAMPTCGGC